MFIFGFVVGNATMYAAFKYGGSLINLAGALLGKLKL